MEIKQKSWIVPFLWLHVVLWFACFYPLAADILYLGPSGSVRFTLLAGTLVLPAASSWYLIRKLRALWQYLPLAVLISALTGSLAGFLCTYLVPGIDASAAELASQRLGMEYSDFLNGITGPLIATVASYLTSTLALAVCMVRAFARIKKGRLIQVLKSMPEGGQSEIFQKGWELPTFLDMPRPKQWIWYALHYLLAMMLENQAYYRIIFWLLFSDILLCLLCGFTERIRIFIRDHRQIANLPAETILRLRVVILGLAMVCLLMFMLPSVLYGREPMVGVLRELKEAGSARRRQPTPTPEPEPEQTQQMDFDLSGLAVSTSFTPPRWFVETVKLVMKTLEYLLLGLCAFWIFRFLVRAVLDSSRSFQVQQEDEVIYIKKKDEENPDLLSAITGRDALWSPNMRIRRRYRRMIRKAVKDLPRGHETPTELETAAGLDRTEEVEQLHEYYERARYSEAGCSRDDVEKLKKYH